MLCTQLVILINASFGTGGSQGLLGHPPILPAHDTNSRPGSFAFVNVPWSGDTGAKSNEFAATFVALNIAPGGVFSALFNDPSKAKLVPEGNRELVTGLSGQSTVQIVPEHEID
jgi:hypothetical protein